MLFINYHHSVAKNILSGECAHFIVQILILDVKGQTFSFLEKITIHSLFNKLHGLAELSFVTIIFFLIVKDSISVIA